MLLSTVIQQMNWFA